LFNHEVVLGEMSLGVAIVLGLSEGTFPRTAREDSILADDERRTLNRRDQGLDLDAGSQRKLLDENFLGYYAFTRAARKLIVTRPAADSEGRIAAPSPFWHRLGRLFPELEPLVIERSGKSDCHDLGTPRQLVTSLMQWVRAAAPEKPAGDLQSDGERGSDGERERGSDGERESGSDGEVLAALYQWLCTHDCCDDAIDVMRYRAWRALSYRNEAGLSPEMAAAIFPTPLHASVTRIEAFATCPFKHFLRFGLRLEVRDEPDVTAMDLGNVYHQVLERIVREMLAARRDWLSTDVAITDEMIHSFAAEVGRTLRGELMLSTARNKYLLARIEQTLAQVIEAQRAAMRRGAFRPAAAEVGFGTEGAMLPPLEITTPKGRKVLLHGKIDRVDINASAGDVAVVDYKLSGRNLRLVQVAHGLSLQLLTYLLVLQSSGDKLFGRPLTPAAAFYVHLLRKIDPFAHPTDAKQPTEPSFHLRVKPRGIFDARVLPELDNAFEFGKSDVVAAFRKQDGQLGRPDHSDVAAGEEFAAMLRYVRRRIGELADEIAAGGIAIEPYRMGTLTPCPNCEFQSVCRFDASINTYHHVQPMSRSVALQLFKEKAGGDGA
jgi:ATP-dependent helicase/nuclease subunit B